MTTDRGALVILPVALGVGSVIPKYGVKPFLYLGTALATAGFPLLSTYTDLGQIEACLVVCVFGSGVLIACNPYSESTMVMIPNVLRMSNQIQLDNNNRAKKNIGFSCNLQSNFDNPSDDTVLLDCRSAYRVDSHIGQLRSPRYSSILL